jgi:hypothetical protein
MTSRSQRAISQAAEFSQPPSSILYVAHAILQDTAAYFLPYCQAGVETACYWFGIETESCQVVTTLAIPRLYQTAVNYRVDTASSRLLAGAMNAQGLVNLAQVHTHPPHCRVSHSPYDDQYSYSTREGALSLVWPDYGCTAGQNLNGVGVHERREGHWMRLSEEQVAQRIHLVDSIADYRWEIVSGRTEEQHDSTPDF